MDDPFEDTLIFVESLIYSDGSKNDTFDHKWHVHNNIPGTVFILEQYSLSPCCLLCIIILSLFIGRLGRAKCTVHSISVPHQPGRIRMYHY